ncbi:MAG: DUF502 domain-containing protein [Albidovulum sp.]
MLLAIWRTGVVGTFLTGLFALLPVILTLLIMEWLIGRLSAALGPGTFFGDLITTGGVAIVGDHHKTLAFVLGVALVLCGVWLVGFLITAFARNRLVEWLDRRFSSIPLVRSIYRPVAQVVRLMRREGDDQLAAMDVVLCRFGGAEGAQVLALLPTSEVYLVDGVEMVLVYLPTAPLVMNGALTLVPRASVHPVEGLDVDGLMKVYMSLGALAPDALDGRLPRDGADA